MRFRRSVVFEIEAHSIEHADEVWCDDGPECAGARRVEVLDEGSILPLDEPEPTQKAATS